MCRDARIVSITEESGRATCFQKGSLLIYDTESTTTRPRTLVTGDAVLRVALKSTLSQSRGDISSTKVFELGIQSTMYNLHEG